MKKVNLLVMSGFTVGRTLTGVRPPKDASPFVIVSCTHGKISFSPSAADLLNVGKGDSVEVVIGENEEGTKTFAVAKTKKGSKLGGHLDFSAANAYQMLGGSTERNTYFSIAKETSVSVGEGDEKVTYFPLKYVKVEAKAEKKAKAEAQA